MHSSCIFDMHMAKKKYIKEQIGFDIGIGIERNDQ